MTTRVNGLMLNLLDDSPYFHLVAVPAPLQNELLEGFKDVDGGVVPASFDQCSMWSESHLKLEIAVQCASIAYGPVRSG